MGVFAGLLSLVCLSLGLAHFLRRSASLMPLLSIALAMVFFMLMGTVGLLQVAAWVWYALCAAALVFVIIKLRSKVLQLFTPGLVMFFALGAFFILIFLMTQPMLTFWDEFTFWGTAGKVTSENHQLYTLAQSSLIARSYPPGLIVYTYMMQFFGGFSEAGFIAAFAIFPLAGFCAASTFFDKNKSACILLFTALAVLPMFFELGARSQLPMLSYLLCMADVPMGVFFGGALCFYFAGGEKGLRLILPLCAILAALVSIKDMGLALALIALFIMGMDMLLCQRKSLGFYRLKGFAAWGVSVVCLLAATVGAYLIWALHLSASQGIDRFDLGSDGTALSMPAMLIAGVKALFGIDVSQQFSDVFSMMVNAFFTRPVSLLGSGAVVLFIIIAIAVVAFLLCETSRGKKRIAVFSLGMVLCFGAFYIFNIFTYAYIFQWAEASVLKDYERYISPFWMGWLMASLMILSAVATNADMKYSRKRIARAASGIFALGIISSVALFANWDATFLNRSPSHHTYRTLLQDTADEARAQGMEKDDVVYIISQYDDATRFYIYGFELEATRVPLYLESTQNEQGETLYKGTASSTLSAPNKAEYSGYEVPCTPEEFCEYLRHVGATHVFLDVVDEYIIAEFGPLFSDELQGWEDDFTSQGNRYYEIQWNADGSCTFLAPEEGRVAS